eukprot:4156709-Pyramimonas_sp.AAC.1
MAMVRRPGQGAEQGPEHLQGGRLGVEDEASRLDAGRGGPASCRLLLFLLLPLLVCLILLLPPSSLLLPPSSSSSSSSSSSAPFSLPP